MYFDLDNKDLTDHTKEEEAFEIIREDAKKIIAILEAIFYIPQEQLEIYFSGGKGLHILVPYQILGIHPTGDLHNVFRTIAVDIKKYLTYDTLDTGIYDKKRLFRLPNSIHGKTGLHKIPLTSTEVRTLSFADIKLLASKPRHIEVDKPLYSTRANRMYNKFIDAWKDELRKIEERKKQGTGDVKFNYTPPCINKILHEGIKEGQRNNTVAVLASHYKQSGLSENECLNRIEEFNKGFIMPPLTNNEVQRTVGSIFNAEYKYGCRTLIEMGLCSPDCKIAQKRMKGE